MQAPSNLISMGISPVNNAPSLVGGSDDLLGGLSSLTIQPAANNNANDLLSGLVSTGKIIELPCLHYLGPELVTSLHFVLYQ